MAAPNICGRIRAIRGARVAGAAIVFTATASCGAATDVGMGGTSTSAIARESIVLEPSSISVSPGGTTQSIGTIRGAPRNALSSVINIPDDVSVRVTSVATTDTVLTKKYIVFADAAVVPGRYVLTVRVTGSGDSDIEAPLTLTVTAP